MRKVVDRWFGTLIFSGGAVGFGLLMMLLRPPRVAWGLAVTCAVVMLPWVFVRELEPWSWSGAVARLVILLALCGGTYLAFGDLALLIACFSGASTLGCVVERAIEKYCHHREQKRLELASRESMAALLRPSESKRP